MDLQLFNYVKTLSFGQAESRRNQKYFKEWTDFKLKLITDGARDYMYYIMQTLNNSITFIEVSLSRI